jgi:hypothetical protein
MTLSGRSPCTEFMFSSYCDFVSGVYRRATGCRRTATLSKHFNNGLHAFALIEFLRCNALDAELLLGQRCVLVVSLALLMSGAAGAQSQKPAIDDGVWRPPPPAILPPLPETTPDGSVLVPPVLDASFTCKAPEYPPESLQLGDVNGGQNPRKSGAKTIPA